MMPAPFRLVRFLMRLFDPKRLKLIEEQEKKRAVADAKFAEQTQELSDLVQKLPQKTVIPTVTEIIADTKH